MVISRRMSAPASPSALSRIVAFAHRAATEAGFDVLSIHRIELAVDEACSNIIDHAYRGALGSIGIETRVEPGRSLTVILTDSGRPFDPDAVAMPTPGVPLDEMQVGGLGLYLMRVTMDTIQFEFGIPGVGNRLTMTKTVQPSK